MHDDRGFSAVELLVVIAVFFVIAAVATPAFMNVVDGMRLGQAAREVERELQDGRLRAVSTNRRIRVRTNCPVAGQYRIVQVTGTAADTDPLRCDDRNYPYNASNQNPVTKLQDGQLKRLYSGVSVAFESPTTAVGIEFHSNGAAFTVDSGGATGTITTPAIVRLTKGTNIRRITINGLGKIQLLQ